MAKAHENLKQMLVGSEGRAFVLSLTESIYSWATKIPQEFITYRMFEEVSVRYATGEKTRRGLDRQEHYRFDAVFLVQPGYRALNQKQVFTVGVEIKGQKSDLRADKKIEKYFGWTDFFFIGVPEELAEEAIRKADAVSPDMVGVFAIDTGVIYKLPKRMEVPVENKAALQEQILYSYIFADMERENTVSFKIDDVEITQPEFTAVAETGAATAKAVAVEMAEQKSVQSTEEQPVAADEGKEAERKQRRLMKQQMKAKLEEQNRTLAPDVAPMVAAMPITDQRVFWAVKRSEDGESEATSKVLQNELQLSASVTDHAVSRLVSAGLIQRVGSKKTGSYKPTKKASCNSTCGFCDIAETCKQRILERVE